MGARAFLVGQAFIGGGHHPWVAEAGAWVWTEANIGTARAVVVDDGGLLYAGDGSRFGGQPADGGTDAFLAEFSLDGELRRVRAVGTPGDDTAGAVAVADGGVVVLAGSTAGAMTESEPAGGTDGFVVRFHW